MTIHRIASYGLLVVMSSLAVAADNPKPMTAQEATDAAAQMQTRLNEAIAIVGQLKSDPKASDLLAKAKGLLLVPHYVQGALVFGGRSGSGMLLVRKDSTWSDPVFYKLSGGTFGVQIGGTKGALAFFLMTDKAIDAF